MLLRRADGTSINAQVAVTPKKIGDDGRICKEVSCDPRSITAAAETQQLMFNNDLQVFTMYIRRQHINHVVNKATQFSSAWSLHTYSKKETWKAAQQRIFFVYPGPSCYLVVDQTCVYT